MAKQLKVEDNYVVHYDTTAGEYVESFAINHCVYRETELAFIILEQIDKETLTINKADVISGAWIDGNSIAYTEDGIRTFLQQSTGFNTASGGSDADYTYAEITLSSTQIKAIGTTPKEILPAAGAGKYYDYYGYIELDYGTAAYVVTDDMVIGDSDTYSGSFIDTNIITEVEDMVVGFNSFPKGQEAGTIAGTQIGYPVKMNKAVSLFTYNSTDPTTGDGTLLVKIWYRTRTFGTEL